VKEVIQTVCHIHKYVNTIVKMELEDEEYAYLKAIVLFSDVGSSSARVGISHLQDAALEQLQEFLRARGRERTRFPKLLLLLAMPRSLHPLAIEKLFFTGIVGSIQIQTVLPYILQMKEGLSSPNMKEENHTD
jgi:hypothetical protein